MKKIKFLSAMLMAIAISFSLFGFSSGEEATETEVIVTELTMEQLQQRYGDNLILEAGIDANALGTINLVQAANPCDGSPFGLCGPVEAQARLFARNLANSCCCNIIYGYECCQPSTGTDIAVLFITEPRPNCR